MTNAYTNPPSGAVGYIDVAAGSTVTTIINNGAANLVITAVGAITTWNIHLPTVPFDGQIITIAWPGGDIGDLNLSAPGGATIGDGAPSSGTGGTGGSTSLQYQINSDSWLVVEAPATGGGGGGSSIEVESGDSIKISEMDPAALSMGPSDTIPGLQDGANVIFTQAKILSGQEGQVPDGSGTSLIIAAGSSVGEGEAGQVSISSGTDGGTGNLPATFVLSGASAIKGGIITINAGGTLTANNGANVVINAGFGGPLHKAGDTILRGGDTAATAANQSVITLTGCPADDGAGNQAGGSLEFILGTGIGTGVTGHLKITNLPTSSSGLTSGMFWLNSNVLTIVP